MYKLPAGCNVASSYNCDSSIKPAVPAGSNVLWTMYYVREASSWSSELSYKQYLLTLRNSLQPGDLLQVAERRVSNWRRGCSVHPHGNKCHWQGDLGDSEAYQHRQWLACYRRHAHLRHTSELTACSCEVTGFHYLIVYHIVVLVYSKSEFL